MDQAIFTSHNQTFKTARSIGFYGGNEEGPSVIFLGGLHGNETSGVVALQQMFERLEEIKPKVKGSIYGLAGNLTALTQNKRFIDEDLNRNWDLYIDDLNDQENWAKRNYQEDKEREDLTWALYQIFSRCKGEIYIFDLHSTSSESVPFISINDTLRNRRLVENIPAPIILGLEEQMEGTLASILTDIGLSVILFEAGQHEDWSSIENHHAFVWLVLKNLGCINPDDIPEFHKYREILAKENLDTRKIFEVQYRQAVEEQENFQMKTGFVNFQKIRKGQELARNTQGVIPAPKDGRVFMPLYQDQGDDGFFVVNEIKPFWLKVSEYLRTKKLDSYLHFLIGVSKHPDHKSTFVVNERLAIIYALQIFHLLGYRKEKLENKILEVSRLAFDQDMPEKVQILTGFENLFPFIKESTPRLHLDQ